MKVFPLVYFLFIAVLSAEVPSLINYQGRLTNADGEPLTGTKNFELKIFDAQTTGNLLYTETFDSVTLGEGGVYNFLFGEAGTSNAQVTETVGNGNGENLYQKILSNENIVDGTISVSDGTYTWSQESGSSNEDDFSASYSKNLKRITVNYFAGAPDDGRDITVTYRHQKTGITGALTGGAQQWMELTVDGETQAARQRIGTVPYALKAGSVDETARRTAVKKIFFVNKLSGGGFWPITNPSITKNEGNTIFLPERAKKLVSLKVKLEGDTNGPTCAVKLMYVQQQGIPVPLEEKKLRVIDKENKLRVIPLNWELDKDVYYHLDWWSDRMVPRSAIYLEYEY